MDYSEDLYGLNTEGKRAPSIIEQICTCKHPRQLEYMLRWVGQNINHTPSRRWYKMFKKAVIAKERELGCRVMYTQEEVEGGRAHGG